MIDRSSLARRLAAEFLGSAFLAAIVIGSGIAAQRLSPSATGLELLENSAATAAGLFAVILMFGPVSGAHFNPVVSLADAALGGISWRDALAYLPAQVAGCVTGAVAANLMFAQAAVSVSVKHRASGAHALSEVIATAGLFAVILMVGPVSGAHFNPVVSFADAALGGLSWRDAAAYLPAQIAGCITGAVAANLMFAQAAVSISVKHRASGAHALSEVIATAGLIVVIFALARTGRAATAPAAVGAYIGAAYWFTSSTSFANPAITIGRMLSNTFAGIAPASTLGFILAQAVGGLLAVLTIRTLYPHVTARDAAKVVLPHAS